MDVFTALADPTRRRIVEMVATRDMSAGQIANNFVVTRPAVSKHLRVLREAGLLSSRGVARQRVYSINPGALDELDAWSARTRAFWSSRLGRLDRHLGEAQ